MAKHPTDVDDADGGATFWRNAYHRERTFSSALAVELNRCLGSIGVIMSREGRAINWDGVKSIIVKAEEALKKNPLMGEPVKEKA